jgi:hypothetical protein
MPINKTSQPTNTTSNPNNPPPYTATLSAILSGPLCALGLYSLNAPGHKNIFSSLLGVLATSSGTAF